MGMEVQKSNQSITPFAGVYFVDKAFNQTDLVKCFDINQVLIHHCMVISTVKSSEPSSTFSIVAAIAWKAFRFICVQA